MFCCGAALLLIAMFGLSLLHVELVSRFVSIILLMFFFVATFVYTKIFLAIKSREPPGNVHDLNITRGTEKRQAKNRQIRGSILKQIQMAKSCFLVVLCFVVCFCVGITFALPYDLNIYKRYALKSWAKVTVFLNSSLNSIIFFWTRLLLRNEARITLKNICI